MKARKRNLFTAEIYPIFAPFKIPILGHIIFAFNTLMHLVMYNPDFLYVEQFNPNAFIATIYTRIYRKKIMIRGVGNDIYPSQINNHFSGLKGFLMTLLIKFMISKADFPIALSKDMNMIMNKFYPSKKILTIPCGIDDEELIRSGERMDNIDQQKELIMLFVGRLNAIKGVDHLIKAVAFLCNECSIPNIRLILVGDGPERKNLELLTNQLNVNDKVTFVGMVPHKNLSKYYRKSNLFILPSIQESFGMVLIEAMYYGLPIIASNVGGVPEIVKDGENGFLVEPGDYKAIAMKILPFINDRMELLRFKKQNESKARKFLWKDIIFKIKNLFISKH